MGPHRPPGAMGPGKNSQVSHPVTGPAFNALGRIIGHRASLREGGEGVVPVRSSDGLPFLPFKV